MTIPAQSPRNGPLPGNGVLTNFPFTFKILDADDLEVWLRNGTLGTEQLLVRGTNYSVNGVGAEAGGSIDAINDVSAPTPVDVPFQYFIVRRTAMKQPTNLDNQGPYPPEAIEAQLDRLTMMMQDIQEQVDRCVKQQVTEQPPPPTIQDVLNP